MSRCVQNVANSRQVGSTAYILLMVVGLFKTDAGAPSVFDSYIGLYVC